MRYLRFFGFIFLFIVFFSGKKYKGFIKPPPYLVDFDKAWVDSTLGSLTLDEKIGQLFMVAAYSNELASNSSEIEKLVENYGVGGILFFQGTPEKQSELTNLYQSKSKIPLIVAIDAEYGLKMRLENTVEYPKQMALGAIQEDTLLYRMGVELGEQLQKTGIHVNLAPVVDINTNPENPVIQSRSFGENKELVANKALMIMKGLQSQKVIATAKHFPGHGDTDTDSHLSLPVIDHPKKRLENIEFYPFKKLIDKGVGGVMIAHLYVPSLDPKEKMASTLSPIIVNNILRENLGFEGLIYTDALNMKGVSESNRKGDIDMEAFLAGNDILLFPESVPKGLKKIRKAIKDGLITEAEIEKRVEKILKAKSWVGLNNYQPQSSKFLEQDLNTNKYKLTAQLLAEKSITTVINSDTLIPLSNLSQKIACISIGAKSITPFQERLGLYDDLDHFQLSSKFTAEEESIVTKATKNHDLIIVGVHNTKDVGKINRGTSDQTLNLIKYLNSKHEVIVVNFGSPYALQLYDELTNLGGLLQAYQDIPILQKAAASAIFGGISTSGKLPVTASRFFKFGHGIETKGGIRFNYSYPEKFGISSERLQKIDRIARKGIEENAYPGCQIFVAKNQEVIYHKTFGHHTYEETREVKPTDLYDIASITKIAATLPSFMKLHDNQEVSLDHALCDYLPDWVAETPYTEMNIREMLAHQAGLKAWIPFYKETLIGGEPSYKVYSIVPSETFPYRVADGLYIHKDYPDSLMKIILKTPLNTKKSYKYSDLGYFFLKEVIQAKSGVAINEFADSNFYKPLGMSSTYLPRLKYDLENIVPTEYDLMFRKQQIHGDVHDPGAAMQGGVGGHAGLFSNANDLAKLMQLYLNWGVYGGKRYLNEELVKDYTKCQFCDDDNRRGAGFDKPVREGTGGPTCDCISYESFGHTGFTGTMAWADPKEQVVYIFLSNRIYPSASNKKLIIMGIRTDIMEVIFEAIEKSKQPETALIK